MKIKVLWLMCLLMSMVACNDARAEDKVLVVHSYHEDYDWVVKIDKAIATVLIASQVPHRFFYMDTKRRSSREWIGAAANHVRQVLTTYQPKVVIAVDDNAQAYVVRDFVGRSTIQFVFCGVNAKPDLYGYPASNVTGILERTYPQQTLQVLQTLLPATRNVAVVCDVSPTAELVLPRIQAMKPNKLPMMQITGYHQERTFSGWKQRILALDQDQRVDALLIPLFHTVQADGSHLSVDSGEIMRWTLEHTRKPVVGLWPLIVLEGGLLAVTVDPHEHGDVAVKMAMEILRGKSAAEIPMQINRAGRVLVNLKHAAHLPFDVRVNIDQVADEIIR